MASRPASPMQVFEIIARIAEFIPLWSPSVELRLEYTPRTLLNCTQVSRLFRQATLPILWRIYDVPLMITIPENVIQQYTSFIRVLHRPYSLTPSPLTCTRLVELVLSGYDAEAHRLVRANPLLRKLSWTGPTEYCMEDIPVLQGDMLQGLTELESLMLSEWNLGKELLVMLLSVGTKLLRLDLDAISGRPEDESTDVHGHSQATLLETRKGSKEAGRLLKIRELALNLQFNRSKQLIDLVCFCPDLEHLTLIAACGADLKRLSSNLARYCSRLTKITIDGTYFGLFDSYHVLEDELMAVLIRGTLGNGHTNTNTIINLHSNSGSSKGTDYGHRQGQEQDHLPRGLVRFEADTHGFEPLLTEALIECGPSLRTLKLAVRQHHDFDGRVPYRKRTDIARDQAQLGRIMKACGQLKEVILDYDETILANPSEFLVECQGWDYSEQTRLTTTVSKYSMY